MSSSERIIIGLGALFGGMAIGLLMAPASGKRTRRVARVGAHRTGRWLSGQVKETQQGIIEAGDEAAERFRHAADRAAQRYIPDVLGDDADWQDVYTRTARDVEDEKR